MFKLTHSLRIWFPRHYTCEEQRICQFGLAKHYIYVYSHTYIFIYIYISKYTGHYSMQYVFCFAIAMALTCWMADCVASLDGVSIMIVTKTWCNVLVGHTLTSCNVLCCNDIAGDGRFASLNLMGWRGGFIINISPDTLFGSLYYWYHFVNAARFHVPYVPLNYFWLASEKDTCVELALAFLGNYSELVEFDPLYKLFSKNVGSNIVL